MNPCSKERMSPDSSGCLSEQEPRLCGVARIPDKGIQTSRVFLDPALGSSFHSIIDGLSGGLEEVDTRSLAGVVTCSLYRAVGEVNTRDREPQAYRLAEGGLGRQGTSRTASLLFCCSFLRQDSGRGESSLAAPEPFKAAAALSWQGRRGPAQIWKHWAADPAGRSGSTLAP